jgi:hypothetical protein
MILQASVAEFAAMAAPMPSPPVVPESMKYMLFRYGGYGYVGPYTSAAGV